MPDYEVEISGVVEKIEGSLCEPHAGLDDSRLFSLRDVRMFFT
uniref:Uncharacterized protein n=1 Tax=Moniliophthora roreri TaxID=221103 RepID=A0A0W0FI05_MONRR